MTKLARGLWVCYYLRLRERQASACALRQRVRAIAYQHNITDDVLTSACAAVRELTELQRGPLEAWRSKEGWDRSIDPLLDISRRLPKWL